jgi:transposase
MTKTSHDSAIATIGIDIGKNTFHLVDLDKAGAIVMRQMLSRGQLERRFANMRPCLIGMETCVGAHHLSRRLLALGPQARLMPARYVKPFLKGQKNDFRDTEAIAEAVQRPTMRFVATKSAAQLDLQALHRVRARLVRHRTSVINQIRALLLDRGIAVRQGYWQALQLVGLQPAILTTPAIKCHLAYANLTDRIHHRHALAVQNIDLAQLRDDLLGLVHHLCEANNSGEVLRLRNGFHIAGSLGTSDSGSRRFALTKWRLFPTSANIGQPSTTQPFKAAISARSFVVFNP